MFHNRRAEPVDGFSLALGRGRAAAPAALALILPDVEISVLRLTPTNPYTSTPVTVAIQICNIGTVSIPGRRVYLYIDPVGQPPLTSTVSTYPYTLFVTRSDGD